MQDPHPSPQPTPRASTQDPHTDTTSSDSSDESESSREGRRGGNASAGSTGRKEEEERFASNPGRSKEHEEVRVASSSCRGDSDEVAKLKSLLRREYFAHSDTQVLSLLMFPYSIYLAILAVTQTSVLLQPCSHGLQLHGMADGLPSILMHAGLLAA